MTFRRGYFDAVTADLIRSAMNGERHRSHYGALCNSAKKLLKAVVMPPLRPSRAITLELRSIPLPKRFFCQRSFAFGLSSFFLPTNNSGTFGYSAVGRLIG